MANTVLIITIVVFTLVLVLGILGILGIVGLTLYLVLSKKNSTGNPTGSLAPPVPVPVPTPTPGPTNPTGATNPSLLVPGPTNPVGDLSNSIYYLNNPNSYSEVGASKVSVYLFAGKQIYNIQRKLYMISSLGSITYSPNRPNYTWSYDGTAIFTSLAPTTSLGVSTNVATGAKSVAIGNSKWIYDGFSFYLSISYGYPPLNYVSLPALNIQGINEPNRIALQETNPANIGSPITSLDSWIMVD